MLLLRVIIKSGGTLGQLRLEETTVGRAICMLPCGVGFESFAHREVARHSAAACSLHHSMHVMLRASFAAMLTDETADLPLGIFDRLPAQSQSLMWLCVCAETALHVMLQILSPTMGSACGKGSSFLGLAAFAPVASLGITQR